MWSKCMKFLSIHSGLLPCAMLDSDKCPWVKIKWHNSLMTWKYWLHILEALLTYFVTILQFTQAIVYRWLESHSKIKKQPILLNKLPSYEETKGSWPFHMSNANCEWIKHSNLSWLYKASIYNSLDKIRKMQPLTFDHTCALWIWFMLLKILLLLAMLPWPAGKPLVVCLLALLESDWLA